MDKTSVRHLVRADVVVVLVFVGVAIWGATVWFKNHEHEIRQGEARRAAALANERDAKSAVARLRNSWNADDEWEDALSIPRYESPYTLDVESVLMKGRPIIVFGDIEDVQKSDDSDRSVVLVQNHGRTDKLNLRLSLLSAPETTNAILSDLHQNSLGRYTTFVFAATITKVEKIEIPPDKSDNDQNYFLAHGILHDAYDTHDFMAPPK